MLITKLASRFIYKKNTTLITLAKLTRLKIKLDSRFYKKHYAPHPRQINSLKKILNSILAFI